MLRMLEATSVQTAEPDRVEVQVSADTRLVLNRDHNGWRMSLESASTRGSMSSSQPGVLLWPLSLSGAAHTSSGADGWCTRIGVVQTSDIGDLLADVGTFTLSGRHGSGNVRLAVVLDGQRCWADPDLRLGIEFVVHDGATAPSAHREYRSGQQSIIVLGNLTVGINVEAGRDIARPPMVKRCVDSWSVLLGDAAAVPPAVVPNHYLNRLAARAENDEPTAGDITYQLRLWLSPGDEAAALDSLATVDHWGTLVTEADLNVTAQWTWDDVVDRLPELRRQLDRFPRQQLNGKDCGIAPYPHGAFSDMSQWFYQPQIQWPFIIAAAGAERSVLVTELIAVLDAYSLDDHIFRPVNTVVLGSAEHPASHSGSSFHWGWAFASLTEIWHLTHDRRVIDRITQLLRHALPALPADHVPRVVHSDLTFNDQPRWGANGAWALGLLAAHEHTGDRVFLARARTLIDGANTKIDDWQRLGSIEDWESFKPDGIASLALANARLFHVEGQEAHRLFAHRWTCVALAWMSTADLAGNFLNAYPPIGPGVSNIGWCRAGGAPDSDSRCEATLELMSVLVSTLLTFPSLSRPLAGNVLHYLAVARHTLLSYCLAGAGTTADADIDLLALELHDNNYDILSEDRRPLVTSYMSGHPAVLAQVLSTVGTDNPAALVLDLRVLGEPTVVVFNPTADVMVVNLRGGRTDESIRLEPGDWTQLSD